MRKYLHCHLRGGLDFEGGGTIADDLLETVPDEHYDAKQRAAKRRRVESIATQYLRGRTPTILSARLRGPFHGGFKNPWAKAQPLQGAQDAAGIATDGESRLPANSEGAQHASKETGGTNGSLEATMRHQALTTIEHIPVYMGKDWCPVPRQDNVAPRRSGKTHGDSVIVPTTSLVTEENEQSISTDYYSAHTDQHTSRKGTRFSPQWLKRLSTNAHGEALESSSDTARSPTPSRHGIAFGDNASEEGLHVNPLKVPATARQPPVISQAQAVGNQWMSSASASMVISSPVKQVYSRGKCAQQVRSAHAIESESPEDEIVRGPNEAPTSVHTVEGQGRLSPLAIGNRQHTDGHGVQTSCASSPMLDIEEADSTTLQGLASTKWLPQLAIRQGTPIDEARVSPPSREEIRRCAERCAVVAPASTNKPKRKRTHRKTPNEKIARQRSLQGTMRAPAPSNSFEYRRISNDKTGKKLTTKSKPRPITFDSSPAIRKDAQGTPADGPDESALDGGEQSDVPRTSNIDDFGEGLQNHRLDVYDVMIHVENARGEQSRESLGSSRHSVYSTQTALRYAQMEFQQGTSPSLSNDTPRTTTLRQDDTPRLALAEASPAITPFHAFNAQLDKTLPPDSVFQGPPPSTQDLLNAVSPYTFSTAKKKAAPLQRSSLRFAVHAEERDERADSSTKSPTPSAERVPLKERNSRVSFRAINGSEKGSQEAPPPVPLHPTDTMKLPQLNFNTPLDGDLDFLRDLGGLV